MLKILDVIFALNLTVHDKNLPELQEKVGAISIDTRTLQPGDIFIALKGDRTDGHLHIKDAIQKGAKVIILDNPKFQENCANHTYFTVSDTQLALEKLAMAYRNLAPKEIKITAITGSIGKTTLKEFLSKLLIPFGKVAVTPKNYNNHIGVPLSLSTLDRDTKFGVFEVGMNHIGEIRPLSTMIAPHIAVITTIEAAHIGNMGNIEAIAKEKADIFFGLQPGGIALLPYDSPHKDFLIKQAQDCHAKILTVGKNEGADFRLVSTTFTDEGVSIVASFYGENHEWFLPVFGEHYALISLFAIAAATQMGLSFTDLKPYLEQLEALPGRGSIQCFYRQNEEPITLIDDSYNATLASMKSGLSVLERLKGKRKIAILGEMRELNHLEKEIHIDLGKTLNETNIDHVFLAGKSMIHTHNVLDKKEKSTHAESIDDLLLEIMNTIQPGDTILLKGSNASRIWSVIDSLKKTA